MKKALFPGSFDPFTIGHHTIVERGLKLFDQIIIGIGKNNTKKYLFSIQERMAMLEDLYEDENRVVISAFEGLTVNYCKNVGANFILRGLRNGADLEYEKNIAFMNEAMEQDVQTVFLLTKPEYAAISSTILREILNNNGDISEFLPRGMKIPK
ncbi:MAG: pantetheine-phosphate adenylyltransferase [Flavobacteriales bacterium]|nr:pantetheine-phosphate adenylyltransferase [Flavobacteriales bacterium]